MPPDPRDVSPEPEVAGDYRRQPDGSYLPNRILLGQLVLDGANIDPAEPRFIVTNALGEKLLRVDPDGAVDVGDGALRVAADGTVTSHGSGLGGGGASYPGVSSDGLTPGGLNVAGDVTVGGAIRDGKQNAAFFAAPTTLVSGIETILPMNSGPGGDLSPDGIYGTFAVLADGKWAHHFCIPVTAGESGGVITVNFNQDGEMWESWQFPVTANQTITLVGMQCDFALASGVLTYSLIQSSGTDWTVGANAGAMFHRVA